MSSKPLDSCNGVYFRFRKTEYFAKGSLHINHKLSILKRKSCLGCAENKCDYLQFMDDIAAVGVAEVGLEYDLSRMTEGGLYKLEFVPGSRDFESGYLEDWSWRLQLTEES